MEDQDTESLTIEELIKYCDLHISDNLLKNYFPPDVISGDLKFNNYQNFFSLGIKKKLKDYIKDCRFDSDIKKLADKNFDDLLLWTIYIYEVGDGAVKDLFNIPRFKGNIEMLEMLKFLNLLDHNKMLESIQFIFKDTDREKTKISITGVFTKWPIISNIADKIRKDFKLDKTSSNYERSISVLIGDFKDKLKKEQLGATLYKKNQYKKALKLKHFFMKGCGFNETSTYEAIIVIFYICEFPFAGGHKQFSPPLFDFDDDSEDLSFKKSPNYMKDIDRLKKRLDRFKNKQKK